MSAIVRQFFGAKKPENVVTCNKSMNFVHTHFSGETKKKFSKSSNLIVLEQLDASVHCMDWGRRLAFVRADSLTWNGNESWCFRIRMKSAFHLVITMSDYVRLTEQKMLLASILCFETLCRCSMFKDESTFAWQRNLFIHCACFRKKNVSCRQLVDTNRRAKIPLHDCWDAPECKNCGCGQ